MSRNGQTAARVVPVDPTLPWPINYDLPRPVVVSARDFPAAAESPRHTHPRSQLLFAERGMLVTTTADGTWVAPPERAIWTPAGIPHVTRHGAGTKLRSIFVRHDAVAGLPIRCAVIQVSPLLRELLLAVMRLPPLYNEDGADGRLVRVLLDRIAALPDEPLHLPMPASKPLRAVASRFVECPQDKLALPQAARAAAMSSRSFARHFLAETGLTFMAWQKQARLLQALELLGAGRSVGDVAFALGYESASAFIAMFRRSLGTTPARYFAPSQ